MLNQNLNQYLISFNQILLNHWTNIQPYSKISNLIYF